METRQILVNKFTNRWNRSDYEYLYTKKEIPSCIFGAFTVKLLTR